MPELPEIELFKNEAIKAMDATIENVEITDQGFVKTTKAYIESLVKGKKMQRAERLGKNLFVFLENNSGIALHFGMTGSLKYIPQHEEPPKYVKCILFLDNNHSLQFSDRRKLGSIKFVEDLQKHITEMELAPDALEIKESGFLSALAGSKTMIKTLLTDQSVLSGIGNVYADEILFQAGIHPQQKADALSEADGKMLFEQIGKVLNKALEKKAEVSSLPDTYLIPRRKEGAQCPRGNGTLQTIKVSGRTTYYCPQCQQKIR